MKKLLLKALATRVSDADWEVMAQHAEMPVAQLKTKVLDAVVDMGVEALSAQETCTTAVPVVTALSDIDTSTKNNKKCVKRDFEVTIFKAIGIGGSLKLCGSSLSDWSADLHVCLLIAGKPVMCYDFSFNSRNLRFCVSPNVGAAKASFCCIVEPAPGGNRLCLTLEGEACVWAFKWHCKSFKVTPVCIPWPF